MQNTVTCPFCNAPVPVAGLTAGESRITCPRCEETVPLHVAIVDAAADTASTAPRIVVPAAPRVTNRAIAGGVVAVMVGMAGLGLAFALRTTEIRRTNDVKGVQPPEADVDSRQVPPPSQWPGLGYLPEDVQAVAGVRVAAALESAAGRALLVPLGFTGTGRANLLGVASGDVEHLLFGGSLRALPPRVTAVIHSHRALSERTRPATGTARITEQHGKSLVRGKLWANGPDGAIWRADDHTLVATLLPEDMDRVPAKPRTTVPMSELLARLDPAALAWLVASVDDTNAVLGVLTAFVPLPPADLDAWTKLQAVAVSVRADGPKLVLTLHVRGREASAGEAIASAVAESLTKAGIAVERRAGSRERLEDWQQLTATADADELARWLTGLRK